MYRRQGGSRQSDKTVHQAGMRWHSKYVVHSTIVVRVTHCHFFRVLLFFASSSFSFRLFFSRFLLRTANYYATLKCQVICLQKRGVDALGTSVRGTNTLPTPLFLREKFLARGVIFSVTFKDAQLNVSTTQVNNSSSLNTRD